MKKVCLFLADGFEEMEVVVPVDILRRGGVQVDLIGVTGKVCEGANMVKIVADFEIHDTTYDDYDLFFLPGGKGAFTLRDNDNVIAILKAAEKAKKWLAAICAAPIVLERTGVLSDKKFTIYPSMKGDITTGKYVGGFVVVDKNVITGAGPAASIDFGLELLETLTDQITAERVRSDILA